MTCPACRESAKFLGYRRTTLTSLFGKLPYVRAYDYCLDCGHGRFPTDEEFSIAGRQTRAAEEVMTLAGITESFEQSAHKLLAKLTGLRVSKSTVWRTTEAAGARLAEQRAAGNTLGPQTPWDWQRDAQGQRVAYVSLDATGVPQADCIVALTDGGSGLQECLQDALAGLTKGVHFILDFFHVSDHLRQFAQVLWPRDDQQRQAEMARWCHTLKEQGGRQLLAELESLELSRARPELRESHRLLTNYLRNNQHRTDYPRYIAHGWHIGSGVIESACKSIVGGRLKGPGMRWGPAGTTPMCQLRALSKSKDNLWDHFGRATPA